MNIIRITESMRKDPVSVLILDKTIKKRYKMTITKAKAWFHTYTDYEVKILDLKTNKIIYNNSANDENNGINRALNYFDNLKTLKAINEHIQHPWGKY